MKKRLKVIATAVATAGAIGSLGITALAVEDRDAFQEEGLSSFNEAVNTGVSAGCSSIEARNGPMVEDFFSGTVFDFETGVCADADNQ